MTQAHYNRFNAAKNYEQHQFRADRVLQSAELNELQSAAQHRLRGIADALFKDGDIIRDARIVVNPDTGHTICEAGAIYLRGAVRGVAPATLVVAVVGLVTVGIYLREQTVTELEDAGLLNPAAGTRGYNEPGAARLQVTPEWGVAGAPGEFYPVYLVDDGFVRAKEAPPNLDAVTQALARYDRDSAGGSYIVSGMEVARAADLASGEQVYTVGEGRARVAGYGVEQAAGRRIVYLAEAELKFIDSEPHQSTSADAQRINLDRAPALGVPEVRITARKTVTLVHGGFGGAADPLPDGAVIAIDLVKQGGTTYTAAADYKLTAGQVDWSPTGAEPAPGSNYQVTYQYIASVVPTEVDPAGFTVTGALDGTLVLVSYRQQLRRIDRLCLDTEGSYRWVKGVSAEWSPSAPAVPPDLLALASIYQSWDNHRRVMMDAARMVPMNEIAGLGVRIDAAMEDQAELRLSMDIAGRDTGIKKGLFADPFVSDAMRDAGIAQTAAIVGGALRLPLAVQVHQLGTNLTAAQAPAHTYRVVLEQSLRTGSMLINPYLAFRPLPAITTLTPNVDRWTEVTTQWTSAVTERLYTGWGSYSSYAGTSTITRTVSESSRQLETLRSISVRFDLAGFGPGEGLAAVTFDGISVLPAPLPGGNLLASPTGLLAGSFTVPAQVPAGTKEVVFVGTGGSNGSQFFAGQGTSVLRTQQSVNRETWYRYEPPPPPPEPSNPGFVIGPSSSGPGGRSTQSSPCAGQFVIGPSTDPLAQTFTTQTAFQSAGVELWFTAKSTEVVVQIREAQLGLPSSVVVVEQRVPAASISLIGPTRITWSPKLLQAGREYALVALCDDAVTALTIAELGKWDVANGRWVTSQPYQVGVLLSSSNANTWTAHQDRDLAFRLLEASYTEAERVIDLGTANLVAATDLMVLGYAEIPAPQAGLVFELVFPDGESLRLSDGQVIWLAAAFTGLVHVYARLRGDVRMAAILAPGVQLVAGTLAPNGDYFTRTLPAGNNSRVKVLFQAGIPGGSSVQVHAQAATVGAPWVEVPYVSASAPTAGLREFTHELPDFDGEQCRVRITLGGGTAARPEVRNLRCVVL